MIHSHKDQKSLTLKNPIYKKLVDFYLFDEMDRDSQNGDITTEIILQNQSKIITAKITAKSNGMLAGQHEVEYFLDSLHLKHQWFFKDGDKINKKQVVLELNGEASVILKVERVILNFLGRMSGIATMTNYCVQKIPPSMLLCPTRKTLWGLLDKKAVVVGGGGTHRLSLSSAFLAKENHLYLLKNRQISTLLPILNKIPAGKFGQFCEIEVETLTEAKTAVLLFNQLKIESAVIMLDNFTPAKIKKIIPMLKKMALSKILFEVSGGITVNNISKYANSGIDIISMGAITHSVRNFDFSLRVIII